MRSLAASMARFSPIRFSPKGAETSARDLAPGIDGRRRQWRPTGRGSAGDVGCISYHAAERRPGPAVLLVHDLRLTSSSWEMRPLFDALRWRRPTFAVDLPGFGLSDRDAPAYSHDVFAAALSSLLRKLRDAHGAVDVVALGQGALPAAQAACDNPSLVRSLATLGPSGLLPGGGDLIGKWAARAALALGDDSAARFFSLFTTPSRLRRSLRVRLGAPPSTWTVSHAHACARAPGAHRAPLGALVSSPEGGGAVALYERIGVPLLVVHDVSDALTTQLTAFLRGGRNRYADRVSAGCEMPQFECPAEILAALDRFWRAMAYRASDRASL